MRFPRLTSKARNDSRIAIANVHNGMTKYKVIAKRLQNAVAILNKEALDFHA